MAGKTLLIVESPAKAKTINKYLGSKYIVEASVGHLKDLITHRLGVDVENGFEPKYTTIRGKAEIIKRLKSLSETANQVLLATDPDREGEAIAWHIAKEIQPKNSNIKRVLFNEITKQGIKKGLEDLRVIDENLFMSQQARRVMDRLIGYQVSPFLSRALINKTTQALSAGRVQSVALRMICEREDEITSFQPIDYWSILGSFQTNSNEILKAKLVHFDGKQIKNPEGSGKSEIPEENARIDKYLQDLHYIKSEALAKELLNRIDKENFSIKEIIKKTVKRNPQAPFTTSMLQQEASKRLGFSNKKTMIVAQKLYEGINIGSEGAVGLITYMRTDSVRVSPEAENSARDYIVTEFGNDYLPAKAPVYQSKSGGNIQDAHEAIRPTSMEFNPKRIKKYLDKDAMALYELIFNRFIASQMNPALVDQTTINIEGGNFIFRASGSVIKFKGFLAVYSDIKEEENGNTQDSNGLLPDLSEKETLELTKSEAIKSQTKSKPRYTEASLVKELDEKGIGRPSTYASIVSTLLDRNYVFLEKKAFQPTELGVDVNGILSKSFPDLFNVAFTAQMETELDTVAEGMKSYIEVLNHFYSPFKYSLENAEKFGSIPEIECDTCGAPMLIRVSRRGRFLGCSKYPDCTFTKPLPASEAEKSKAAKEEPKIAEGIKCEICGKDMAIRDSKFGKFYGCIDYPKCKGTKAISSGIKCPKCNEGTLLERYSPKSKKKFWGCSNYPKCDFLTNFEPIKQSCPSCDYPFLEVHYKKSADVWLKFLQCRNCKEKFDLNE